MQERLYFLQQSAAKFGMTRKREARRGSRRRSRRIRSGAQQNKTKTIRRRKEIDGATMSTPEESSSTMQRCTRSSRERRSKSHDNVGRGGEGGERRRSTTSSEGRGEEGREELAGCLGARLTTSPDAFVAGASQAGRQADEPHQKNQHLHRQQRHSRYDRAAHTWRQAATQIEPQDSRGIDWINSVFSVNRSPNLRDFAGLESQERICGPLPDQTRIRPYFWNESDPGVPSDSPPKLTARKELLESLPKPLIFNILLSHSAYFKPLIGSVNCEVITAPSLESEVITFYLQVMSSKSTAMVLAGA